MTDEEVEEVMDGIRETGIAGVGVWIHCRPTPSKPLLLMSEALWSELFQRYGKNVPEELGCSVAVVCCMPTCVCYSSMN